MKSSGLIWSAGIYTGSNIVTAAIPFMLLPVLTRVLSPADYGIVAMFGIMVSVFSAFTGLGTQGAIEVRYFDTSRAALPKYVTGCMVILACSTLVLLLVSVLFGSALEAFSGVPRNWLLTAVLVAAMQFVVLVRLSLWLVARRPLQYGVMQIGQSALNAGLSLFCVLALGLAWRGRTYGIAAASAVTMLTAAWSLRKEGWLQWQIVPEHIRAALRFGVPLIPHTLGALLIAAVDRIMVTNLLDIRQTGIYTVALQVGMLLSLTTGAFNRAYAPWLFERLKSGDHEGKVAIVRNTYIYFITLSVATVMLGYLAPLMLSVLVGSAFRGGAGVIGYVAAGFAFGGMYYMVTNYVFFAGATARLAFITLASGVVNVLVTYALVRWYGLQGAGIGFAVSQGILFAGTWRLASKVHPMPWRAGLAFWR
jgi:O-antigen/teichoic acid export membrane protein